MREWVLFLEGRPKAGHVAKLWRLGHRQDMSLSCNDLDSRKKGMSLTYDDFNGQKEDMSLTYDDLDTDRTCR
jgi:hypothetical protein